MILALYTIILSFLTLFSYNQVDPNITFINHQIWTSFRNYMVEWGYYRRDITSAVYLITVILLFLLYRYGVKKIKIEPLRVAIIIGGILLLSYPFLSHDFFNYLFDAKIFTVYGANPYTTKPGDFPADEWLRFMHWTHRTYPYGPVFLVLSFIPLFASFGKFVLAFGFFKLMNTGFYLLGVYALSKISKKTALMFALHPLILIEGLVNGHNDLIGVTLTLYGIMLLRTKHVKKAWVMVFAGVGVKYLTAPFVAILTKHKFAPHVAVVGTAAVLGYLAYSSEIQPWYFLAVFALLPFFPKIIEKFDFLLLGLLFSYYPYLRFGGWGEAYMVNIKHVIIWVGLGVNAVYLGAIYVKRSRLLSS